MLWTVHNIKSLHEVRKAKQKSSLALDWNKPCKDEIKKANIFLSDGHAAGPDGVPVEAKKADVNTPNSPNMLHEPCQGSLSGGSRSIGEVLNLPRPPGNRDLH